MSSAHRGECVTTGGLYRPTHLCVAHFELHKKKFHTVFLWCGKVGACFFWGGGGGGSNTLNGAPVECGEDGWRETCSFQPAEKV